MLNKNKKCRDCRFHIYLFILVLNLIIKKKKKSQNLLKVVSGKKIDKKQVKH